MDVGRHNYSRGFQHQLEKASAQAQGLEALKKQNSNVSTCNSYITTIEQEINQRRVVIELLDKTCDFYTEQNGDVQTLSSLYKAFGRKLRRLQKRLEEKKLSLSSPGVPVSSLSDTSSAAVNEEVSSLDQRLLLLTQDTTFQDLTFPRPVESNISLPCGQQAEKSPNENVNQQENSPHQAISSSEGDGNTSISPKKTGGADTVQMDVDGTHSTPCSSKDSETPEKSSLKPDLTTPLSPQSIHLQSVSLVEAKKSPTEENPDTQFPVERTELPTDSKSSAKENPDVQVSLQSMDLTKTSETQAKKDPDVHIDFEPTDVPKPNRSPAKEVCDSPLQSTSDLPEVKSATQNHNDDSQSATQVSNHHPIHDTNLPDCTLQASLSDCKYSECMQTSKPPVKKDAEVTIIASSGEKGEISSNTELHDNPKMDEISPAKCISVCSDNHQQPSEVAQNECQEDMTEKTLVEGANNSHSGELLKSKDKDSNDAGFIFMSEHSALPLTSPVPHHGKAKCGSRFMYHMLQTVVAFEQFLPHCCNAKSKTSSAKPVPQKDIMNLCSMLFGTPSSSLPSLNNNNHNRTDIVISDKQEEVQKQLTANIVAEEKKETLTESLEIMDMDLGSSDEEMT